MQYLRFKSGANLEELERFGFKRVSDTEYKYSEFDFEITITNDTNYHDICICEFDDYVSDEVMVKLYDLIQAGLVEKEIVND